MYHNILTLIVDTVVCNFVRSHRSGREVDHRILYTPIEARIHVEFIGDQTTGGKREEEYEY